jgi:hypothetical protein
MRFPTDLYMTLKLEALNKRVSLTSLIHSKLRKKQATIKKPNVEKIMVNLAKLARETSRQNPNISFSEKLIEMRYEQ